MSLTWPRDIIHIFVEILFMKSDSEHIQELEKIIKDMYPYYVNYFNLTGKEMPEINVPKHLKIKKPLAALLSGDFRCLPRTGESQETQ